MLSKSPGKTARRPTEVRALEANRPQEARFLGSASQSQEDRGVWLRGLTGASRSGDDSKHAGSPHVMPGKCAWSLDTGGRSALAVPRGPVQTQMIGVISGKKYPRGPSWVCSFFCSSAALTKLSLLSLVR